MNKNKQHTFDWAGKNARGRDVKGHIVADSMNAAKIELKRQNITPRKITKRMSFGVLSQKSIKSMDVTIFSRQMATMLKSGLSLMESLQIVADGTDNQKFKNIILTVREEMESGLQLSAALAKHPLVFDNFFTSLVAAGEVSGKLDTLLDKVATHREKSEMLKQKIKKAMKYPITVVLAAVIVTVILMLKVIPVFKELFESFGGELPAFTQMVVNASEFTQQYWIILLIGSVGSYIGITQSIRRSISLQHRLQKMSLKLPIFGDLIYKGIIARFSSTLQTNFEAGVPLIECLKSAADASGNIAYYDAINDLALDVASGQTLGFSMKQSCMFPDLCVQLVKIGEDSGSLETMLGKVAGFYENEVDNAVDGLTSMMEPLIMMFLGVVVGGLVVAMYLPIFQMGAVV